MDSFWDERKIMNEQVKNVVFIKKIYYNKLCKKGKLRMNINLDTNVKKFYMKVYPDDTVGAKIKSNLTFRILLSKFLLTPKDIYDILGVCDSAVRERIFEAFSDILKCDYDVIYYIWLKGY